MAKPRKPKTDKQKIFVAEYTKTLNATQSAIKAGYSKETSGAVASQLLKHQAVSSQVSDIIDKRLNKIEISAERILEEIAKIAFANVSDIIDWNEGGAVIKESSTLDPNIKAAVQEITSVTNREGQTAVKVKMHDKLKALELLGRYHEIALWKDVTEVKTLPNGETENFREALQNVRVIFNQLKLESRK